MKKRFFIRPTDEMTDDDVVDEIMAFIDQAVAESRATQRHAPAPARKPVSRSRPSPRTPRARARTRRP